MLVKVDSRFATSIAYWSTEKEADAHAKHVRDEGDCYYNGFSGFYDGARCGREPDRDGPGMFAVTFNTVHP